MFAHTGLQRYLNTARRLTAYWITHTYAYPQLASFLGASIPFPFPFPLALSGPHGSPLRRDLSAPSGPAIADTSAAMVAANGLLLLAQQEQAINNASSAKYYQGIVLQVRLLSWVFLPVPACCCANSCTVAFCLPPSWCLSQSFPFASADRDWRALAACQHTRDDLLAACVAEPTFKWDRRTG
jgi:hypothetical protein